MTNSPFLRWSGMALAAGGALTLGINVILTPLLPRGAPFAATAASSLFLWRQGASALAAALLLLGCVGLYLRQAERTGRLGAVAFIGALLGSALVLAWEWVDVFVLRSLAQLAPDALRTLEGGGSLYDMGALIPVGLFALGWIGLAAATLRGGVLSGLAASLVIAGFFLIPLLSAILPRVWGPALGNAVLGSGWIWLGRDVFKGSRDMTLSTINNP